MPKFIIILFSFLQFANFCNAQRRDSTYNPLFNNWQERIYTGGNFGMFFGSTTYIEASPFVGYRLSEDLSVGTGIIYRYYRVRGYDYSMNIIGYKGFARYQVWENLFAYGEYENLYGNWINRNQIINVPSLFLGGGYSQSLGMRSSVFVMLLYNALYDPARSPYPSPIVFRMGVNLGF